MRISFFRQERAIKVASTIYRVIIEITKALTISALPCQVPGRAVFSGLTLPFA
jgi:hypothetical protein